MIELSKISSNQIKFLEIWKIDDIFYKFRDFFSLLYNVYKKKMFTNEIEDGQETP